MKDCVSALKSYSYVSCVIVLKIIQFWVLYEEFIYLWMFIQITHLDTEFSQLVFKFIFK